MLAWARSLKQSSETGPTDRSDGNRKQEPAAHPSRPARPAGYLGTSRHVPRVALAMASRRVAIAMYPPLAQRTANER